MFGSLFRRKKSNQKDVANTGAPDPSQQSVPCTSDDAAFSGAPSMPEKTTKTKKKWKSRLLNCFQKKKNCNSEEEASKTTESESTRKQPLWPFKFWKKKKNQVTPATVSEADQLDSKTAAQETSSSSTLTNDIEVVPCIDTVRREWDQVATILFEQMSSDYSWNTKLTGTQVDWDNIVTSCLKAKILEGGEMMAPTLKSIDPLGFPNIGNSCYMNSCLQSLFSLEDFINDISCQENLWSSVPEAQLLRRLVDIRDCRELTDYAVKNSRLCSFKSAFATHAPEYSDSLQKDAHEFLTLLMTQIQSMSPHLQASAAVSGQSYTCPAENQFSFQMENKRTCQSCGLQSSHQEDFMSLSLDLIPEGSITDMLEAYLKEKTLEFRCECGGTTSALQSSFDNLPRVLVLHLKRFRVTPTYKLEKLHDAVKLDRNVVVSSKEGGACYNLDSIINHNGNTEMGHYTCNSIHPSESPESQTDRWLTFNDAQVSETTGSAVCEDKQRLAYILFYKKIV